MPTRQIRLIELSSRPNDLQGIDIVLVDGLEGAEPDLRRDDWRSLLQSMIPSTTTASISHLSLGIKIRSLSTFIDTLKSAHEMLLDEMYAFCKGKDTPMVFFGYRLAGISLKQALCTARSNAEQDPKARQLIANTFGIVLLGTPHSNEDDPVHFSKTISILIEDRSIATVSHAKLASIRDVLGHIASEFSKQHFSFRCLNFVETEERKYGRPKFHRLGRREKRVLVGQDNGKMDFIHEVTIPIKGSLRHLFKSEHSADIKQFFASVLDATDARRIENSLYQHGTEITQSKYGDTEGSVSGIGLFSHQRRYKATHEESIHPMHLTSEPPEAKVPCYWNLPDAGSTDFFGREEVLEKIHVALFGEGQTEHVQQELSPSSSQLKTFVLSGKPGMGKTAIAREYAQRYKHDYDAIAWLVADSDASLQHQYAGFASVLDIIPSNQADLTVSFSFLRQWLSHPVSVKPSRSKVIAKWLLIMDDVKAQDFTLDLWPREAAGAILVVGRSDDLGSRAFLDTSGHDLEPLLEEDAARLFQSTAGLGFPYPIDADLLEIIRMWDCVPFPIVRVATEFRNAGRGSSQGLLEFKRDQILQKAHFIRDGFSNLSSIAAVWTLNKRETSERALLGVLAMLQPAAIPEEILTEHWTMAKLMHYPDVSKYTSHRKNLKDDRLIEYSQGAKLLSMDHSLQEAIKATYLQEPESLAATFNATARLLSGNWPKSITTEVNFASLDVRTTRRSCERLVAHVDQMADTFQKLGEPVQRSCATRELAIILIEASWYRMGRGMLSYTKTLLDTAALTIESTADEALDLQSALHNTAGAIALASNELELCLQHNESFKDIQERIFLQTNVETTKLAAAYSELGMANILNERSSDQVLNLFDKSESIRRRLEGFEEVNLFNTLRGKGYVYLLRDDLQKSYSIFLKALSDREEKFGKENHLKMGGRSAALLFDLGNVTYKQGAQESGNEKARKLVESYNFYVRAEEAFKETDGPESLNVADAGVMVARHLLRHGKVDELFSARGRLQNAISSYRRTSSYQRELARALFLLGTILTKMNEEEKGRSILREAEAMWDNLIPIHVEAIPELKSKDFDYLISILKR